MRCVMVGDVRYAMWVRPVCEQAPVRERGFACGCVRPCGRWIYGRYAVDVRCTVGLPCAMCEVDV